MSNDTVSVNVPGYGPVATPLVVKVKLDVPFGSHENSDATAGVSGVIKVSPVSVACADAGATTARQTSSVHADTTDRIRTPPCPAQGTGRFASESDPTQREELGSSTLPEGRQEHLAVSL